MGDWPTPGAAPCTYRAVMKEGKEVWAHCTGQHASEGSAERCANTALDYLKAKGHLPAMWIRANESRWVGA